MFYEDAPEDKYTWEGFQAWAMRPPAERPPAPTRPQLKAMGESERAQFELARRTWHAELNVATPAYREVQTELENHLRSNVGASSPRLAAMINGTSGSAGQEPGGRALRGQVRAGDPLGLREGRPPGAGGRTAG